jgi:hypothetical protein
MVQQELAAHRKDHAESHARILEMQEGQHSLTHKMEAIHLEQKETKSKLTEAGKPVVFVIRLFAINRAM